MAIKRNKKYNNVYSGGGLLGKLGSLNESLTDKFLGEKTLGNLGKLGITKNNIGGISNTAATMLGGVLAGQNQSGVGNAMQSIGSLASNIPGVGGIVGAGVNLLGGITNAAFGSHLNQENIDRIEGQVNDLSSFQSVASDYDALSSEYSNAPIMGYFSKDAIGSDGWFSNKAKNKWRDLLNEKSKAEDWVQRSLANNALNIANNTLSSMEANYTAYGGPLTMKYSGLMSPFGNQFESGGGIHIKKKNRGKFTSYCGGKVTNECIQRGLHSSNPTTRKRANFARNARGWKHADGGGLYTDKELFANDIYNAYKLRLLRDNINPEQAHRVATYMTMQSAGESGYGSSKASKGYNYAGHLSKGEGSAPKVYKSFDDFVDYHYANLKNNWPDFINSSSVEDFYNKIHTGKKYSNDSRDKYLNLIKGTGDRVNRYLNSYNNSYESYLKSLPPNLRNTAPNLYDLTEAYKGGLRPEYSEEDKSYHLGSRNPKTGKYLKKAAHPTFLKSLLTDASLGYFPYIKDGQLYTDTWEGNKKSMGGNLTHGGIFDNGLLSIDSGGTHEENPFEGVQMGVDPQGVPNLVEEGEVVYNDYVFSNRMRVPKAIRHKYKLRDNITFADAVKYLSKESKERPNDPISQNGLNASLSDLAQVQEDIRIKKQARENNKMALGGLLSAAFGSNADNYKTAKGNLEFGIYGSSNPYAEGGKLGNLFNGVGDKPNRLTPYSNFVSLTDDSFYTPEYMGFWNWYNTNQNTPEGQNWLKRINSGEFGSIGGNTFTPQDILKLSHDYKKGPVHNAFVAAAAQYNKENPKKESYTPYIKRWIREKGADGEFRVQEILDKDWNATPAGRTYLMRNPNLKEGNTVTSDKGDKDIYYDVIPEELPEELISDVTEVGGIRQNPLRYAPLVGSGIAVLNDIFGGNDPDYSNADIFANAIRSANRPVSARPIGEYLTYRPFDRMFYINQLNKSSAASRMAAQNTSGGNRAAALAGILTSDYNYGESLGKLARQAEEYNQALREKVAEFNRQTNMFNSEQGTKVDMFNSELLGKQASMYGQLANIRQRILENNRAEKSANLTNFIQGLGDLGREATDRDTLRWLADIGALPYNTKGQYTGGNNTAASKRSKVGKMKRKKGFTV